MKGVSPVKCYLYCSVLGVFLLGMLWTCSQGGSDKKQETRFNRIKWVTAREINNQGFNIYRGTNPDGPFHKINQEPIPGAGTSQEPQRYEYIDDSIDPTRTYYYYVENITTNGGQKRFTPILEAPPKVQSSASSTKEKAWW